MSAAAPALTWSDPDGIGILPDGYDPDGFVRAFGVPRLCLLAGIAYTPGAGREIGPAGAPSGGTPMRRRRARIQRREVERLSPEEQDRRMDAALSNLDALDMRRLAADHPPASYAAGKAAWNAVKAEAERAHVARQMAAIDAYRRRAPSGGRSPEEQASRYLDAIPGAVSGAGLDIALRRAAMAVVCGFALPEAVALALLVREYAPRCQPTPPLHELRRKVRGAARARLTPGYLLAGSRA